MIGGCFVYLLDNLSIMKKFTLLFLVFLMVQVAMAQPPEYFVDHWYLHSFSFDGEVVYISDLEISEGPTLIINEDLTLYGSSFCNTYTGSYEYIDNDPLGVDDNFIPRDIIRETQNCEDLEEMETHFFIPFVEEKTADIYVINSSGTEKHIVLQYDHTYGYQEYKNFPALEIKDAAIKNLIVFPNPVQNELTIQSTNNTFDSFSITDSKGRVVLFIENSTSYQIDVSALASGLYFLHIQSSEGKAIKKFIKN